MQVTAERKGGPAVAVEYDFGDDISALTDKFGSDVVFSHARRSFVVALQSYIRTQIEAGKSPEEIQTAAANWKPGQRKAGKSISERASDMLSKLSPQERAALLKEYKARDKAAA